MSLLICDKAFLSFPGNPCPFRDGCLPAVVVAIPVMRTMPIVSIPADGSDRLMITPMPFSDNYCFSADLLRPVVVPVVPPALRVWSICIISWWRRRRGIDHRLVMDISPLDLTSDYISNHAADCRSDKQSIDSAIMGPGLRGEKYAKQDDYDGQFR